MEYQVPQFIEVEDKIFGPLTIKQFIYLAGGIGIAAAAILYLPFILGIIIALPVGAFAGALAFYKINGKPFIDIIEAGFNYYMNRRLYLWRKEQQAVEQKVDVAAMTEVSMVAPPPREKLGLSGSKLHELATSLDSRNLNSTP